MTDNQQIATTIMEQLGGRKFTVMTGAKNYTSIENGLKFSLPARFAKNGINRVTVELDWQDTYTVNFYRVRGASCKLQTTSNDIYADQLQRTFTEETGLDTSMGRIVRAS